MVTETHADDHVELGTFFVLEGGEGAGKSRQAKLLAQRLRECGRDVIETFEPGATSVGSIIRQILLDPNKQIDAWAETLLYAADRAQHAAQVVQPALLAGSDVVCDRHVWSSLAYQGSGRGLGVNDVAAANQHTVSSLPEPIVILLDIAPEVGLGRVRGNYDRMESETLEFHNKVRESFLQLASDAEAFVIEASSDFDVVAARVWQAASTSINLNQQS